MKAKVHLDGCGSTYGSQNIDDSFVRGFKDVSRDLKKYFKHILFTQFNICICELSLLHIPFRVSLPPDTFFQYEQKDMRR